ncbi:MAG: Wzz/FepE/Etk N-terminal domain-containing protein [Coriobacteriales bacterium]|nr:Wzz/FepE/Etk N-terminal domain-containing protein [Coriobacteriales bacterium]
MEDSFAEVDILELIKKNFVLLVAATLVFGVVAFAASYLLPNTYTASTSMYVLRQKNNEDTVKATGEELSYANTIAGDVLAIMNSSLVKKDVAEELGIGGLGGCSIATSNESSSRLVTLTVTGPDPELVAQVANSTVANTAKRAKEIMKISAINVIDEAVPAGGPSGPDHKRIGLYGAAAGFALAFAISFIRAAMDTRIRTGDEATKLTGVPVIGHFGEVEA